MNIKKIAEPKLQDFIFEHEKDNEDKLVLTHKDILGVPSSWIASQIKARKKASVKIPLYHQTKGIVYPPSLNLEQSSSEQTARFKSHVVSEWIASKRKFCDLTGGFGIDSFFLASVFSTCDYCEPQNDLLEIAKQNHELLGAKNIHYHNKDAVDFLSSSGKPYDFIYIDPSRRTVSNKKVFRFCDCNPDIVDLHEELYRNSDRLMIKASPLLDIRQGINDLRFVSRVLVVSVENECKELLFLCEHSFIGEASIECYNLDTNQPPFTFSLSGERSVVAQYSDPLEYICEPNASILKGGAFKSIASAFNLKKIEMNTHLYTTDRLFDGFPGRVFQIVGNSIPEKANIVTRNYPLSVEQIKKKMKIGDGGSEYILCFTGQKKKFCLPAKRLS